ncbi:MAG: hypothetical protein JSR58_07840 [Verrucomicrobia bacterium]|nr:hypothetical protein [Verrucomicrobiota bacterium]
MRIVCLLLLWFSALSAKIPEVTFQEGAPNKIGYLHLTKDYPIDTSTVLYVRQSLEHFAKEKVVAVVFELDTPGGEVFAALKISQLLKDFQKHTPVVAYINDWAISAGAMLAYSCQTIAISPSASMGAAEPVIMGGEGGSTPASEKVNSALRAEFANLASLWGRNPHLAEAMVDKDILLVWRGSDIVRLDREDQMKPKDIIITKPGKLLTLNAEQMRRWGVADAEGPSVQDLPFFAPIPQKEFITYEDWKIDFFAFLTHPMVASLLTMGLMLGIYLEVQNPGLIFPIVIGGTCLFLLLLSRFALEAIHWIEPALIAVGVGLVALELFMLPGLWLGILGALLALGGLIAMMVPHLDGVTFAPTFSLSAWAIVDQLAWIAGLFIVCVVVVFFLARRMLRRFAHQETLAPEEILPVLEGALGKAFTPLRPSGKVELQGIIYEAMSEGQYIEKGAHVAIVRREGNRLYVRSS